MIFSFFFLVFPRHSSLCTHMYSTVNISIIYLKYFNNIYYLLTYPAEFHTILFSPVLIFCFFCTYIHTHIYTYTYIAFKLSFTFCLSILVSLSRSFCFYFISPSARPRFLLISYSFQLASHAICLYSCLPTSHKSTLPQTIEFDQFLLLVSRVCVK